MMLNGTIIHTTFYLLIPFLLRLKVIQSNTNGTLEERFNAEYLFDLNKTTVVHREPLQTTQLTATLICQPWSEETLSLYCFLQNVNFLTALKFRNSNVTKEIFRKSFESEHFKINFNERGVKDIVVNTRSDKIIKSIVKDIANQFNIGSDRVIDMLNTRTQNYTHVKTNTIGTCSIKYSMDVYEEDDKKEHKIQIIPSVREYHTDTHIRIEKNTENCDYSEGFKVFLNGMEMNKYSHKMEIFNDKLNISTTMNVRLPSDPWNPSGSPVFTETVLLNLTNITSPQTLIKKDSYYEWSTIKI